MTNKERLAQMSVKELAAEFDAYAKCAIRCYVDFEKWLESEDEEYPIRGYGATFVKDFTYENEKKHCIVLEDVRMMNSNYRRVAVKLNGLHAFQYMTIPADHIRIEEE